MNLPSIPDRTLAKQGGFLGWVLNVIKARRARLGAWSRLVDRAIRHILSMPPEERTRAEELLSYLYAFVYHERKECEKQPLLDRIEAAAWKPEHRQELNQMGRTIAEALREEGRAEERVRSARSTLLRQLRRKFGDVSQDMAERIEGTTDLERLTTWLDRIVTVETLEELGIGLEES